MNWNIVRLVLYAFTLILATTMSFTFFIMMVMPGNSILVYTNQFGEMWFEFPFIVAGLLYGFYELHCKVKAALNKNRTSKILLSNPEDRY